MFTFEEKKNNGFWRKGEDIHMIRINFHLIYSFVSKGAPGRRSNLANVSFVFKHQF